MFGVIAAVFVIALAMTGLEILRSARAYKTLLAAKGTTIEEMSKASNPISLRTGFRVTKQAALIFRPHADIEVDRARLRVIRGYQIWLLLMFLAMVSALALLVTQGSS